MQPELTRSSGEAARNSGKADFSALDPCVHCGFCLPACPTYLATGDEADSPRGRIVLMRALERGELDAHDDALNQHLDACLGCRGCEPACPSGVGYGRGLEAARAILAERRGLPARARLILDVFRTERLWRAVFTAARWLRRTGLPARLAGSSSLGFQMGMLASTTNNVIASVVTPPAVTLERAQRAVGADTTRVSDPVVTADGSGPYAARDARRQSDSAVENEVPFRGRVALFRGCVMDTLFRHVNDATRRTLQANGYEVVEVANQGCCGALHEHAGDRPGAERLAARNVYAFAEAVDFIVVNSAGCGALLKDYGHLLGDDAGDAFGRKVRDVSELLADAGPRPGASLDLDVGYDAPCHLQHAQRVTEPPLAVLNAVPGLRVRLLPGSDKCCGSAGVYSMLQPGMSRAVLDAKIAAIAAVSPRPAVIATGNPGCLMQIGAGLRAAGLDVGVLHPVELLDRSYADAGLYAGHRLYLQACTPPSSSISMASSSTTSPSTATH